MAHDRDRPRARLGRSGTVWLRASGSEPLRPPPLEPQSGGAANVYFGPTCCRLTNTYRVPSKLKLSTCRHPAVATERRRLDSPCVTALSTLAKVIDRAVQGTRAIQPRRSAGRTSICNGHGCEIQNGATANRFQRCSHRPFPLIG